VERRGSVLLITLDRPEVLNAVDAAMTLELGDALDLMERSPDIRVAVLTGEGRAFCAGLDMKAVAAGASMARTRHPQHGFAGMTARTLRTPIIAALNGDAIGGGLEIALACDLIVAADDARLGLPEVRHGVFAAGGGVARLAQRLPRTIAVRLLLTGEFMTAATAHGWGLVNAVVPRTDVLSEALMLAEAIAANAPQGIRATKAVLDAADARDAAAADPDRVAELEAIEVFASRDAAEGIAAFAEGRRPRFLGT
jgi:crotonobetainyl-CoA hydratase